MSSNTVYKINIPEEFYNSYKDDQPDEEPLIETFGEYLSLGSYDFLIAQARYFAWPHLTDEILTGARVHEDTHNSLTMATALGHLELHIKSILELTPKIPPVNKLAQALRKYLGIIVSSSKYTQETAATISAYTALWESYGLRIAEQYLDMHRRKEYSGISPYTTFVDKAIDIFHMNHVPKHHWSGYVMFLASLAMNTDIDELAASLPDFNRFKELCAQSPIAADLRFIRIFKEFEESIEEGGLPTEKKNALERSYNHLSGIVSSDLPRLLAKALLHQLAEFDLSDFEKYILDYFDKNPFGYPGQSDVQTVFYAAQPKRRVKAENYFFYMDDETCAKCDLVEMGLASFYENVTYGGISMNFYVTNTAPIRTGFWMLHPCCAKRCYSLLDKKTLVIYLTHSFLNSDRTVEPIRKLISGHRVIYVFFGNYIKFVSWAEEGKKYLKYTIADMQHPPVRFVLLQDKRDRYSTYVLPVAPIRCAPIDDILLTFERLTMSEFADENLQSDLEKFFRWYIFAPVTC